MSKNDRKTLITKFTIVLPCYNEAHRLALSLPDLFIWRQGFQERNKCLVQILLANDGCTDKTIELAKELSTNEQHFDIVGYDVNQGRGAALKLAFASAWKDSSFVLYMDADLATDLQHVQDVLDTYTNNPHKTVVCGNRYYAGNNLKRPLLRKIWSWGWRTFVSTLFLKKLPDTQCGFKALSADLIEPVMSLLKIKGFVADIEIILRAWSAKASVISLNIKWVEKKGSTIRWSTIFKMLLELKDLKSNQKKWLKESQDLGSDNPNNTTDAA
ncbi:MAG: glycosyltransferase [Bdellovibrionota bacterium]